jgi:hypothetical protein
MGSSKGSSATQVEMSPEQRRAINAQTDALTGTFLPAYQKTIGQAQDVYGRTLGSATSAANTASDVAGRTGAVNEIAGTGGVLTGMSGLASLFDPNYEEGQVQSALQSGRESGRELVNSQNASYGASGGLGSARSALAGANLASLQEQRQSAAAADARARVQANKAMAANQLATLGGQNITAANTAAASRVGYAMTPQDVLAKYASVVFGAPQANTTPNFAGTQSSRTSGKSSGISI